MVELGDLVDLVEVEVNLDLVLLGVEVYENVYEVVCVYVFCVLDNAYEVLALVGHQNRLVELDGRVYFSVIFLALFRKIKYVEFKSCITLFVQLFTHRLKSPPILRKAQEILDTISFFLTILSQFYT